MKLPASEHDSQNVHPQGCCKRFPGSGRWLGPGKQLEHRCAAAEFTQPGAGRGAAGFIVLFVMWKRSRLARRT